MKRWFAGFAPCTARHAVLIAIAVALPSSASLAQGTRAQRMACSGDVWRLCSSAIPSVDRIVACLKREKERLSPGCQAVFNGAEAQTATNRAPTAAPSKPIPRAQPEQAASTPAAAPSKPIPRAQPEQAASTPAAAPSKAVSHAQPEQTASAPAAAPSNAVPPAQPEQAASAPAAPAQGGDGRAAAEQPKIVTRTLAAAPAEETASAGSQTLSGVGRPAAAPAQRVASRDVESTPPVSSRHGRQQREAYHQSSNRGRSGNRYGGMMQQLAPLIAMAMGGSQGGGGFDAGSMMGGGGGRGNFDVGQMMGMARGMGFDPGSFMGGGGYSR